MYPFSKFRTDWKLLCLMIVFALVIGLGCSDSDDDDDELVNKSASQTVTVQVTPMGTGYGFTVLSASTRDDQKGTAKGYAKIMATNTLISGVSGQPAIGNGSFVLKYSDGDSEATFPGQDFTVPVEGGTGELVSGGFVNIAMKDANNNPVNEFTPGLPVYMTLNGKQSVTDGTRLKLYRVDDGKTFQDAVIEAEVIVKSQSGEQYVEFPARKSNATYIIVIIIVTGSQGSGGATT